MKIDDWSKGYWTGIVVAVLAQLIALLFIIN